MLVSQLHDVCCFIFAICLTAINNTNISLVLDGVVQAGLLWNCDQQLQGCTGKNNFLSLPPSPKCFIYISSIPAGMHTGISRISDPELNCCRADQETWQVLGEAELLSQCSNYSDSMNLREVWKGCFWPPISSISSVFSDFQKNCHITWFFIIIVGFTVLWG